MTVGMLFRDVGGAGGLVTMVEHRAQVAGGAPDPREVGSPTEFIAQLRLLKVWAGNPSFERLARISGVPRSTLADALSRRGGRLPTLELIGRFVRACDVSGDDALAWEQRWRQLQSGAVAPTVAEEVPGPGGGRPVPRQLPADVSGFVGRSRVISELGGMLKRGGDAVPVVISAVSGTAGVGKTALAVHWAHQVRHLFPDGQLYVNLRGHHPGPPVRSIDALAEFLHALGTPPEQVPVEVAEAAAAYRSLLADRRVLVLLDNAASPEQVRPLLPGTSGCFVLTTSRDNLSGLVARDGARRITLDRLSKPEGVRLLRVLLGRERVGAEPDAAADLVERCVGLPLALRIAAAHLSDRPNQSLASYTELLDAGDRLAALQVDGDPHTAVRAAFDLSYGRLNPAAQRLFRLLGLVPGPDVTAEAAAALSDTTTSRASQLLGRLTNAHLLDERPPGRYTFHDLLRAYATKRSHAHDSPPDRDAATQRLYRHYQANAHAAAGLLYPQILRVELSDPGDPAQVLFADPPQASAWLNAERPNLVAAITHTATQGPPAVAWQLADALRGYFWLQAYTVDWLTTARAGLAAAEADHNLQAQAVAQLSLANVCGRQGQGEVAIVHSSHALELARRAGWKPGQAAALGNLGILNRHAGRLDRAIDHLTQAIAIGRQIGQVGGLAACLGNLGIVYEDLGQLRQAAHQYSQALTICREVGAHSGEANALSGLGEISRVLGRLEEAMDHVTQAVALRRRIGDRGETEDLRILATVHRDAGRYAQAHDLARAAVTLSHEVGDRRVEADVLNTIATIHHRLGQHPLAIDHHQHALRLAADVEGRQTEIEARVGLAVSYRCVGQYEPARTHAQRALDLARQAGYRVYEGQALAAVAAVELAQGQVDRAIRDAELALAIHRETGHRLGEARTHLALGNAISAAGDADVARQHWHDALDLFDDIGAAEAEEGRALLAATHRGQVDGVKRAEDRPPDGDPNHDPSGRSSVVVGGRGNAA
jgi:tetratricopeptide (TPR) repeat protein